MKHSGLSFWEEIVQPRMPPSGYRIIGNLYSGVYVFSYAMHDVAHAQDSLLWAIAQRKDEWVIAAMRMTIRHLEAFVG